jgi:hypothetical protein
MQRRAFRDRTGVNWIVKEVAADEVDLLRARDRRSAPRSAKRVARPSGLETRPLNLAYLAFDSPREHRRIQPIPDGWYVMSDEQLEDLLGAAQPRGS